MTAGSLCSRVIATDYVLLSITMDRLHFWQHQLQAAFRDGNEERAVTCEHIIAEYRLLIAELIKQLPKSQKPGA